MNGRLSTANYGNEMLRTVSVSLGCIPACPACAASSISDTDEMMPARNLQTTKKKIRRHSSFPSNTEHCMVSLVIQKLSLIHI